MEPTCKLYEKTANVKASMRLRLAREGEGVGLAKVQGEKKNVRMASRVGKRKNSREDDRNAMKNAGLVLCYARCLQLGGYCNKVYYQTAKEAYKFRNLKHSFTTGQNARDHMLREASKPGGMVEAGSRPDRQTNQLHESIVASEDGKVSEIAARCRRRFNQKDASKAYQKPAKLVKLYFLGMK
jgi:hypothetical protein